MIPAIKLKDVSFKYDMEQPYLLQDINLSINEGEVVAILGMSGCGKSTLCKIISGVIPRTIEGVLTGSIKIYDKELNTIDMRELTSSLGIVFQDPDTQLFSPTVIDEIAFGMENHCHDISEMENRIEKISKETGVYRYLHSNPNNLSGGEKQLVVLSSVLCMEPSIIILDESMAQVDERGSKMIKENIRRLKNRGKTIIMIEHDLENIDVADRVLYLEQGRLVNYKGELG